MQNTLRKNRYLSDKEAQKKKNTNDGLNKVWKRCLPLVSMPNNFTINQIRRKYNYFLQKKIATNSERILDIAKQV